MATTETSAKRLLIANRGEIANRILRTARSLNYCIISIYMPSDTSSPHVTDADVSIPVSSYTDIDEIIAIIRRQAVDFVISGYGFLSENAKFAAAVEDAGAVFVGPDPEHIVTFGIKDRARDLAAGIGIPVCPGSGIIQCEDEAVSEASKIGYPIMLKATAGGGGMGLKMCENESQVRSSFASVVSRGAALFSNPGVFLERYYPVSRHIEIQIFGDGHGDCVIFGERECSIQRRHQKVIEESPSPFVETRPELRERLVQVSRQLASSIKYKSAGTIEYLVDDKTGEFFFLEMNTRLQVEHGITELRFGIDLVALMLKQAEQPLNLDALKLLKPSGAAIEARIYAENPFKNHLPGPGQLQLAEFGGGPGIRVDTWVQTGTSVSLAFDPLLAKVMAHSGNRDSAISKILEALYNTKLLGLVTNTDYLWRIFETEWFREGKTTTNVLDSFGYTPQAMEIISPGSSTTVQDFPGRVGVGFGIPEGGPADALHARLANCVVGNDPGCELLEITLAGPNIKFHERAIIALAGGVVEVLRQSTHLSGLSLTRSPAPEFVSMVQDLNGQERLEAREALTRATTWIILIPWGLSTGQATPQSSFWPTRRLWVASLRLLVQYNGFIISQARLLEELYRILEKCDESSSLSNRLFSRHIRLPMVFDDKVNRASVERYMHTQRPIASYLPDPIEFIARSNGLKSKQEVLDKVLSTRILVVGVGFWSGTPIGFPVDPRCRLMVPKFNPSRTFSPAGGLGIGGSFFCCDPTDAPGGYVNFGRTLSGWDKFCVNKIFGDRPWLFENFDQLSFYVVDENEFEGIYSRFQAGKYQFDITQTEFDVDEYTRFCESVADETAEFRARQEEATAVETEKEKMIFAQWQNEQKVERDSVPSLEDIDDTLKIEAAMHASIYKIKAQKGDTIREGDVLVILEAMKMEINIKVSAAQAGLVVESVIVAPCDIVKPGDVVMVLSRPVEAEPK
ncbi:hypothetical protein MY3296_009164 [Beauveria thailandica]